MTDPDNDTAAALFGAEEVSSPPVAALLAHAGTTTGADRTDLLLAAVAIAADAVAAAIRGPTDTAEIF